MIELESVTKRYGDRVVVDRLWLTVPTGSFCVLLGPSGCGKSTTLRMINRLVPLDAGRIRIDGEDISGLRPEVLRRRIGYAIQSTGLFPHWRVEDNIATVPRLLGWPRAKVRDRVTELLEMFRLDPATYRGKYPHQLSGGEQQRVGVARALAADPDLLLMDEPFGAVDPLTRDALQAELAYIHRATGKTILFVTHDIEEALRLADTIVVLDQGSLAQVGAPLELLEAPASGFVRDFVGTNGVGLKLLSLRTVADRMRPGRQAEAVSIALQAPLRDALELMTLYRTDRLSVVDEADQILGTIRLADLIR